MNDADAKAPAPPDAATEPATDRTVQPEAAMPWVRTMVGGPRAQLPDTEVSDLIDEPPPAGPNAALDEKLTTGSFGNQRWGDFELGEMLGYGGMGAVYKGRQVTLDRPVAVKVLGRHLSGNESFRLRFLREARAVAQINSPHVVQIYAAGVHAGHHYFVMELVEGVDLARKLSDGFRPSNAQAFNLVLQAGRGLAAAGNLGIVHRDIKPANMLITPDGVLKLTDFGLVKLVSDADVPHEPGLTGTGIIVGTANYFSPEQGLGERCDQRTDLYALGVVLYQLLTGRLPFTAPDPTSMIYQHVHERPRPPRQLNPSIHPDLESLVLKCLQKKPEDRPQSATELVAAMESLAMEKRITARGGGTSGVRWLAAAAIAATLIAGATIGAMTLRPAARPPDGSATGDGGADDAGQRHQSLADLVGPKTDSRADAAGERLPDSLATTPADDRPAPRTRLQTGDDGLAITAPVRTPIERAPAYASLPPALTEPTPAQMPAHYYSLPPADPLPSPAAPAAADGDEAAPSASRVEIAGEPSTEMPAAESTRAAPIAPRRDAETRAAETKAAETSTDRTTPPEPSTTKPSATRTVSATVVTSPAKPPRPAVAATAAAAPPVIATVPPIEDRDVVIVAPKAAPKPAERSDEHGRYVDVAVLGTRQRFRYCPPGRFLMGSPDNESRRGSDEDIHQVTLTQGFWIADSECTQALWNAVMGYDPSSTQDLTHPVEQVSWDLVQQFLTKLAPLAPGLAPRLPSETEWEYACRAGSSAPFAADIESCGWYDRTSGRTSRPVKQLAPNAWGLFDCHGNVSEWCQDSFGDYPKPVVVDPPLRAGGAPVIRGGSFRDHAEDCRSAHRDHARARAQNDHLGFRIASSVVPGP